MEIQATGGTNLANWLRGVLRFHREVTGMPVPDRPTRLGYDRKVAGYRHLREELYEFRNAQTFEEEVDAIIDLVYVALGRLLEMGVAPGPAFDEVHRANLERKPGTNARRGHVKHDAVKPEGWRGPQLMALLTLDSEDMAAALRHREMRSAVEAIRARVEAKEALGRYVKLPPVGGDEDVYMHGKRVEPHGPTPPGRPKKATAGKPPYSYVPTEFMDHTSAVFDYGAWKYARDGYMDEPPTYLELIDALLRHAFKFKAGQDLDLDRNNTPVEPKTSREYSGLNHIGNMGCCVAMLAWVFENRKDRDDRRAAPHE